MKVTDIGYVDAFEQFMLAYGADPHECVGINMRCVEDVIGRRGGMSAGTVLVYSERFMFQTRYTVEPPLSELKYVEIEQGSIQMIIHKTKPRLADKPDVVMLSACRLPFFGELKVYHQFKVV